MIAAAEHPARVRVLIPGLLVSYTAGERTVEIDVVRHDRGTDAAGPTLADALATLDARYPGLRFRVVDEQGRIRRHIRMFVDREQARELAQPLPATCELMIVGALSGG